MVDTSIRARKRERATHVGAGQPFADELAPNTKRLRSRRVGLFFLLVFGGFLIYWFPAAIKAILEPWIEFSEPVLHGVNQDIIPEFHADVEKQAAIVKAFKHAWLAYEKDAMGDDEYHPISQTGSNLSHVGGIGYTVIDSLDTMMIMGLDEEVNRATTWIRDKLSFDKDDSFNLFETTIRVLGGLLSAYHLSGEDHLFLEKAIDLADRLLPAFNTPSGVPHAMSNLARKEAVPDLQNNNWVSTAEATTLQLEFRYLSMLTDEDIYWRTAEKVMARVKENNVNPRLVSILMDPQDGKFVTSDIRLGSRGDSFYEYLLKQYLQTARTEPVYREMYEEFTDAVQEHLVKISPYSHLTYTAELVPENTRGEGSWRLQPKQDHLVCFLGGSLMLGATTARSLIDEVSIPPKSSQITKEGQRDWRTGVELIRTCMNTHDTRTGLSPEIVYFRIPSDNYNNEEVPKDWYIKGGRPGTPPPLDARYILRPETVESLFIAFRLTGDNWYRDQGWRIFQAIQRHCKIESGGYASVTNVDDLPVHHEDKMETFMMSETLKYLYLLFSDSNVLPLSDYVFNTEAHPFPILTPTIRTGFS